MYEKYDLMFEAIQNKLNIGELTLEDANRLNDLAYEKYVIEKSDSSKDVELVDDLKDLLEDGKVKLDSDTRKSIKTLVDSAGDNGEDEGNEETPEEGEE